MHSYWECEPVDRTKLASLCPELLVPGASLGRAASGVSVPALFGADYLQRISGLADGLRNGWPSQRLAARKRDLAAVRR